VTGTDLRTRLREALGQAALDHGLELIDVELSGPRGKGTVRVFLDQEDGIDIDAIAEATRWVVEVIEATGEPPGTYVLEVSSPGIERPLVTAVDFSRFAGERASVTTSVPVGGRKRFSGRIVGVEGEDVVLDADGTECRIAIGAIHRARLKVDIDFSAEGSGT
jgi:ribosome maturation factor RimP